MSGRGGTTSLLVMLAVVGIGALALRLWFVGAVVADRGTDEILELVIGDSKEYWSLATRIARHGAYAGDTNAARHAALVRPPGYPLLCAPFARARAAHGVLWTQAVIGAAACSLAAWVAFRMVGSVAAGWAVGVASTLSVTGIGLTGLVLADLLFAALFLAGFAVTLVAARRVSLAAAIGAGLIYGVAALVKPVLMFWPVALLVVWPLLGRALAGRVRWGHVLVCVIVHASVMAAWCGYNFARHGTFVLSSVDARNLRYIFAPLVEEWAKAGRLPPKKAVYANYFATKDRLAEVARAEDLTPAEFARLCRRESMAIIRAHPSVALTVYAHNLWDHWLSGFDVFDRMVPPDRAPLLYRALQPINAASRARWPNGIIIGLAVVAPLVVFASHRRARRSQFAEESFRELLLCGAAWLTLTYFFALGGSVYRASSRILYPAEFAVFVLVVFALRAGWRLATAPIDPPGAAPHRP